MRRRSDSRAAARARKAHQCSAQLGQKGRCTARATMAYGRVDQWGEHQQRTRVFERCPAHPLKYATASWPIAHGNL
jgi:hypothetical protein